MNTANLPPHDFLAIGDDTVLIPIAPYHADELFALIDSNRDILGRWLLWIPETKTVADTSAFIQKSMQDSNAGVSYVYVIMVNNAIAGCFDLRWVDLDRGCCTIGYWLGKNYQGRGIMTHCVHVMTQYAFDTGLKTIEIACATENYASQNVAKRAGYTFSRTKPNAEKIKSHMVDHHIYSKIAP